MTSPTRPPLLLAALRILGDTAAYRLRKREAGNLVTTATLAVALGLPGGDIAWRVAYAVALNLFVYVVNDLFDVAIDLQAPGRDVGRTRFLADNLRAGWVGTIALGLALGVAAALRSVDMFVAYAVNVALIVAYSRVLKRQPIVDLVAMAAWGVTMAMVGFPLASRDGWVLAGLLGCLCAVTESVQVIRDEASDRAAGVRTTAAVLGAARAALLARALIVGSAAYAALLLHRYVGLVLLGALAVPLAPARIERSWDTLRVLFGITWLVLLAAYVHDARSLSGWLALP